MTEEFTYRDCQLSDIESVLSLWSEAGSIPGPTDTVEALEIRLERDPQLFLLAFDADRLVGSLLGGWDGWRTNMYRLAVAPSHRRKGIASVLVQMIEDRMKAMGADTSNALVVKPELEPAAVAFWESAGYVINPRLMPFTKAIR